jgi:tripartite-type tricarboxylate transporter receptor subunit TctC
MGFRKWLAAGAAALIAGSAFAQGYPNKPVHMIISFTPGSATDIVGRVVAAKLSEYWGQPVVAENRAGAGGSIGTAVVAKAAPDGYTLLVNSSAHVVNPGIYAHLPYDVAKDFVNIAPLAGQPNVLVVAHESKIKTIADLIAEAKANPGKINFGHAGIGSGTHLNTEKLIAATGIKVVQVPYKGTPEVIADILGGRTTTYLAPISAAISMVKSGKLRALAVSTIKRNSQLPDVPTIAETGIPGFDFTLWFGLWGPAGMAPEIVEKINADVRRAVADPATRDKLIALGNDTMSMTSAQFSDFVRSELADTLKVLKEAGIKPQ